MKHFSNIAIAILDFHLLLLIKLSLLILLLSVICVFFEGSHSKVIALPTIALVIRLPLLFANAFKSVKERTKKEASLLLFLMTFYIIIAIIHVSNNCTRHNLKESNSKYSNIAIKGNFCAIKFLFSSNAISFLYCFFIDLIIDFFQGLNKHFIHIFYLFRRTPVATLS